MNRSMVVTEVCTISVLHSHAVSDVERCCTAKRLNRHPTAIGRDGHAAVLIGSPHRHTMRMQATQGFPRGMTIVVASYRDDRSRGAEGVEPFLAGTATTAVMTHLQQIYPAGQASHGLLGWESGIARKQYLEVTVLHE